MSTQSRAELEAALEANELHIERYTALLSPRLSNSEFTEIIDRISALRETGKELSEKLKSLP